MHASQTLLANMTPQSCLPVLSLPPARRPAAPGASTPSRRRFRTLCIATAGIPDGGQSEESAAQAPPWGAPQVPPRADTPSRSDAAGSVMKGHPTGGSLRGSEALPLSLLTNYERLPEGDSTQFTLRQPCNIEKDGSCKLDTQVRVWERQCTACNGSGFARSSRRKGYSATSVCMLCSGIGYVRCSSTRLQPRSEDGDITGLGRT